MAVQMFAIVSFSSPTDVYAVPPQCFTYDDGSTNFLVPVDDCLDTDQTLGGTTGEENGCYIVSASSLGGGFQKIDCDDPRIIEGDATTTLPDPDECADAETAEENCIVTTLAVIINFFLGGVAFVITLAIIVSGLQYMISQGNAQNTAAARDRIINCLIAIALYALAFPIIQWLIPGGVFN